MITGASKQCDPSWGVRFVCFEIKKKADGDDGNEPREVDVEMMWLRAIGSRLSAGWKYPWRGTHCQNNPVSSSLNASTPHPGLQLLTVQLAKLPISFKPNAEGSKGASISIGTAA